MPASQVSSLLCIHVRYVKFILTGTVQWLSLGPFDSAYCVHHHVAIHPRRQHHRARSDGEIMFVTQPRKTFHPSTTGACCNLCFHVPTTVNAEATPIKTQDGDPSPPRLGNAIRSSGTLRGGSGTKDGRPTKHLSNQQLRSLQSRLKALSDHVSVPSVCLSLPSLYSLWLL